MINSLATIFGVCTALVAAVLGLAYPMFVERVKGFDDKYGTRVISEKFESENLYKALKLTLVVCVIKVVVLPFVTLVCNSHILNIVLATVLAICVFALCIIMIGTFNLMVVYSDPARYLKRAKEKEPLENIFQILQILIVQGSKKESNDDLYNDAMREFGRQIMEFQYKQVTEWEKSEDKSKGDDFFIYPSHIYQALLQIERRGADPENVILNKRADIIEFLYNVTEDFRITDQVYKLVWFYVNRMVEAKHDDWVKNYWRIATQYYTLKLDHSNNKDEKGKFLEFHLMVGVLLLYRERYDVLRYAFTFTNSYPPKYPLIPNTFLQIFDWYEKFPWSDEPFYILKYNMIGDYDGARTEPKIEVLFLDYIALLMIRLFSVDDYNITFSDPMSLPSTELTIEENKGKIKRIKAIIGHLEAIPDEALEVLDLKLEWRQKAKELLKKFMEECTAEEQSLSNIRNISEKKEKE